MTIPQQLLQALNYIDRLLGDPSSFSKEEIKDQPTDGPLIKALKNNIRTPELIKQKDNSIQSLQLKNEKLLENQKKLYGYLGDAWKMVSHLQTDLQTEKQDKAHIQKELDDTLAILNKPTAEMGTQTDLTAEQITQMEKDLANQTTKIAELDKNKNELVNQITQKETEINQLKEQAKDLKPNPMEKALVEMTTSVLYDKTFWQDYKHKLEVMEIHTGGVKYTWNDLRYPYTKIKTDLLDYANTFLKKIELEQDIKKEVETRNQLQTKYDMEVRSKEELSQELQKEKGWWDKWLNDEGEWIRELPVYHDRDFYIKGVPFGSTSMFEGSKMFVGQKRRHYNTISTPANFRIGSISLKYDTSPPSFEKIKDYVASTYGTFTLRQQKLLFKKSIYEYYKNK